MSQIYYKILRHPSLPVILDEESDRILLERLEENNGLLFIDIQGMMFVVPNSRLVRILNDQRHYEQLTSPLVRRPKFYIRREDCEPVITDGKTGTAAILTALRVNQG